MFSLVINYEFRSFKPVVHAVFKLHCTVYDIIYHIYVQTNVK